MKLAVFDRNMALYDRESGRFVVSVERRSGERVRLILADIMEPRDAIAFADELSAALKGTS
jgi:hypothetical protein